MGIGIISIRKIAQKLLAPVVLILVVALTVGVFYIGIPAMNKDLYVYRGKAVKLDGEIVKDDEFQQYILKASQQAQQFAQYGMQFSESQVRDSALNMAISELAIKVEMKKVADKIKVTDADAEKLIKKYLPTEEELQSFLERQGYQSKKDLVKVVKKDLEKQKFFQLKARDLKVKVPKAEVLGQLEEVTVSHILVSLNDQQNKPLRSDDEALKRANEVIAKLNNGANFADLAKEYSDDPGSKDNGGKYGPMPIAQFKISMVKEFVDSTLALKEGAISQPVKTQYGYHVIKLDKRSMPTGDEYKKKYKEAEDDLLLTKAQESPEFEKWMTNLNEKANEKMEILDPGLRAYRLAKDKKWAEAVKAYEKAITTKYYKKQWDVYMEATEAYINLKNPTRALEILNKIPAEYHDSMQYQVELAKVYKADNKVKKAEEVLTKFSAKNPDNIDIHQQLKQLFTEWKMTESVKKEEAIIAKLEEKAIKEREEYQKNLNLKAQQSQAQTETEEPQQ